MCMNRSRLCPVVKTYNRKSGHSLAPTSHPLQKRIGHTLTPPSHSLQTRITQAIEKLSSDDMPPKWPVRLTEPVINQQNAPKPAAATTAAPAQEQAPPVTSQPPQQAQPSTTQPTPAPPQANASGEEGTPWLHDKMSKPDADGANIYFTRPTFPSTFCLLQPSHTPYSLSAPLALLVSQGPTTDGKFFVRERGENYPGEYVIAVIYKGKPTVRSFHHVELPIPPAAHCAARCAR